MFKCWAIVWNIPATNFPQNEQKIRFLCNIKRLPTSLLPGKGKRKLLVLRVDGVYRL